MTLIEGAYIGANIVQFNMVWPQRGQCTVFCFLSSLPLLPQPPRQCLGPTCHLSTLNKYFIAGADLPNHMMGEVSWDPKRRRLYVFSPLCFVISFAYSCGEERGTYYLLRLFLPAFAASKKICVSLFFLFGFRPIPIASK
jgi:hypothetical protein